MDAQTYPLSLVPLLMLAGCMPAEQVGRKPDGKEIRVMFYPGGSVLDDLSIIDGINYFGTAQYQADDPLGDVGFRLKSGPRVQAECISIRINITDEEECARYEVYRSSFTMFPEGTPFSQPELI